MLELDVASNLSVAIDELSFLLELLDVDVSRPNKSSEDPHGRAKSRHKSIELLLVSDCQEAEEYIHHHRNQNHDDGDVNVRVVQTSHEGKHEDKPSRLQTLAF